MVGLENKSKVPNSNKVGLHLKNGTHLGKYRLKRCLGTGGACEVWEARDSVEGIWVALKNYKKLSKTLKPKFKK